MTVPEPTEAQLLQLAKAMADADVYSVGDAWPWTACSRPSQAGLLAAARVAWDAVQLLVGGR